ncbi:MAG: Na-translocating system protein MpsB, partial [Leadbetterella sp.]|nr:Na-translocating system protein MpsB [Leadbetterella sp.]
MDRQPGGFDEAGTIAHLRHYLPAQHALKDFVHHNTLHAFQHKHFEEALYEASVIFGYRTYLSVEEFRAFYREGKIREDILDLVLKENFSRTEEQKTWKEKLLTACFDGPITSRIGQLRSLWKKKYSLNMDKVVYPVFMRLLSGFLDQGIAISLFPHSELGFLDAVRQLDLDSYSHILKNPRARNLLHNREAHLTTALEILVGDESLYGQYLFDQQFSHPGWSGFVSVIEKEPSNLLIPRKISLEEIIYLELLLEIDALDGKTGGRWKSLKHAVPPGCVPLFSKVPPAEIKTVQVLWQKALEWSYFNDVMEGIRQTFVPGYSGRPA